MNDSPSTSPCGPDQVYKSRTLSNPDRRKMLDLLRGGGMPAGDLAEEFPGLPQAAVSRHLRTLREAGLVTVSPKAHQRVYCLDPTKLPEVDSRVSQYREFWPEKLDSLSSHLGSEQGTGMREE